MMWRPSFTFVLLVLLAVACNSGGPNGGLPDDPETDKAVSATITEAGGSVSAVTRDGAVLTLAFPEGAVTTAFELTLSPHPPEAGAWARLALDPVGIRLKKPVQISLTAPAGRAVQGSSFFFGASDSAVLLPTQVDTSTRTLSTSTLLLGYAPADVSTENLYALSNGSGFLNVGEINCTLAIISMKERLEYARTYSFSSSASAHALITAIAAAKELCAQDPDDTAAIEAAIEQAKPRTCAGYQEASTNAAVIIIEDAETLQALIMPVLGWEATKQVVGAECGPSANELIDDKYEQFIGSYTERINSPDFGDGIYRAMWAEFANVFDVLADTQLLGLEAAETKTSETLVPTLLDRLRDAGYRACRDDDTQQYLAALLSGGHVLDNLIVPNPIAYARFSAEELERDIQYCASKLTVTGFDGTEQLASRELHGGATPGEHVDEVALSVPVDEGVLVLQGDVHAFTCLLPGQSVTLGSDELVIKVDGEEVRRLQHGGGRFFVSALDLPVAEILEQAGLDPETVEDFELTVYREGPACDGHYGEPSYKLFTVAVNLEGELVRIIERDSRVTASVVFQIAGGDGIHVAEEAADRELQGTLEASFDIERDMVIVGATGAASVSTTHRVTVDSSPGQPLIEMSSSFEGSAVLGSYDVGRQVVLNAAGSSFNGVTFEILESPMDFRLHVQGDFPVFLTLLRHAEPDGAFVIPITQVSKPILLTGTLEAGRTYFLRFNAHLARADCVLNNTCGEYESGHGKHNIDASFTLTPAAP